MDNETTREDMTWIVLINASGEYSLWPAFRPVPEGWRETGPEGDLDTCTAWVDTHWLAMRPASKAA